MGQPKDIRINQLNHIFLAADQTGNAVVSVGLIDNGIAVTEAMIIDGYRVATEVDRTRVGWGEGSRIPKLVKAMGAGGR